MLRLPRRYYFITLAIILVIAWGAYNQIQLISMKDTIEEVSSMNSDLSASIDKIYNEIYVPVNGEDRPTRVNGLRNLLLGNNKTIGDEIADIRDMLK